jgi:hypothetical protein
MLADVFTAMALLAASDIPAAPVLGLMFLGVVMAIAGHIARDRRVVGLGIGIIFLATLAMVVFAFAAFEGDDTAGPTACPPGISGTCH